MKKLFFLYILFFLLTACNDTPPPPEKKINPATPEEFVPTLDFTLVNLFPHDTAAFTEGFLFHKGQLYESTGSPENYPDLRSFFGTVDLKSGRIDKKSELSGEYFGEGIAILNNKIYQLTYKNQMGFIYDVKTYKLLGHFSYTNKEGWGLTTDGTSLIMSDGTNVLTYLDPSTLKVAKSVSVTNGGYPENNLNELEYIRGFIYANVWTKNYVVKIDPANGKVCGLLNFSALTEDAKKKRPDADVLNGIAYDSISDKIMVTGKLWENIYQVNFSH
jgi:glutaminyl-peptide cyclotransferase